MRYDGGRDFAASTSEVVSHTYSERVPTALSSRVSSGKVAKRQAVRLSGALTIGPTRAAVRRAPVVVYRKMGTGPWTQVRRLTTAQSNGSYATTLRPVRTALYKVVYVGSAAHFGATAPVRTVAVR